jgi:hypothetical protein
VPPPSSTSTRAAAICFAISNSEARELTWAAKEAGVAWVTLEVATSPVAQPRSRAASSTVFTAWESGPTPIAPLKVRIPAAYAVAAAALSVMSESKARVSTRPITFIRSTASASAANRAADQ